jgi:hypothetical protein
MKTWITLVGTFMLILLIFAAISCAPKPKLDTEDIAKSYAIINTKRELHALANAFLDLTFENPELFNTLTNENSNGITLDKYFYKLTNYLGSSLVTEITFRANQGHAMVTDWWNNPIQVKFKKKMENPHDLNDMVLFIWSFGPNGRNENGTGDDLVVEEGMHSK